MISCRSWKKKFGSMMPAGYRSGGGRVEDEKGLVRDVLCWYDIP